MPNTKFFALALCLTILSPNAFGEEVCGIVKGASVVGQDDKNTYLGSIASKYEAKSIFNEYGTHGSEYSADSIWNAYGTFGSEYSAHSPNNSYTATPPMIIKSGKIIGYLSANKTMQSSISPNLLKALCKDDL